MEREERERGKEYQRSRKTYYGNSNQTRKQYDNLHTIFIDGLSSEVNQYNLRFMCKEYGIVIDSFIPQKTRRNTETRFGFIRYKTELEALRAINALDGVKRFENFIRVKKATYERRERRFEENNIPSNKERDPVNNKFYRSYSDVVKGNHDREEKTKTEHKEKPEISVKGIRKEWLDRCLIGRLDNTAMCNSISDLCRSEGVISFDIKLLAGPYVLLIFDDENDLMAMKEDNFNWLKNWFTSLIPWTPEFNNEFRYTWITCIGVPIHAWDYDIFKQIGEKWGEFIEVDDNTRNEQNFNRARILISTNSPILINEALYLKVDNLQYKVSILEEPQTEIGLYKERRYRKTNRDSDDQSSEDTLSEYVGGHKREGEGQTTESEEEEGESPADKEQTPIQGNQKSDSSERERIVEAEETVLPSINTDKRNIIAELISDESTSGNKHKIAEPEETKNNKSFEVLQNENLNNANIFVLCADNQSERQEKTSNYGTENKNSEANKAKENNTHKTNLELYFERIGMTQKDIENLENLGHNISAEKMKRNTGDTVGDYEESISEFSSTIPNTLSDQNIKSQSITGQKEEKGITEGKRKRKKKSLMEINNMFGLKMGRKIVQRQEIKISKEMNQIQSETTGSDSITDNNIKNRNEKIYEEALRTIEVGKKCGLTIEGEEVLLIA